MRQKSYPTHIHNRNSEINIIFLSGISNQGMTFNLPMIFSNKITLEAWKFRKVTNEAEILPK